MFLVKISIIVAVELSRITESSPFLIQRLGLVIDTVMYAPQLISTALPPHTRSSLVVGERRDREAFCNDALSILVFRDIFVYMMTMSCFLIFHGAAGGVFKRY